MQQRQQRQQRFRAMMLPLLQWPLRCLELELRRRQKEEKLLLLLEKYAHQSLLLLLLLLHALLTLQVSREREELI